METVLISGIGGPTPRSIARAIKDKYPEMKIIGIDANPKAIGFYMHGLLDKWYVTPRANEFSYWSFIKNLIQAEHIDFAIIQPEKEVIAWGDYYIEWNKYPCPIFLPEKRLALSLVDKALMADILQGTEFIPKTIKVTQQNPKFEQIEKEIGFPCWIRATQGSGGLGSLKLGDLYSYKSWLLINESIDEFTISEFLTGRHLANQMLYYNGEYIKGASLECAEYVMANIAPSKVTGNTSFGRFLNEDRILDFSNKCMKYICSKLNVKAHGVLSFDLKEDASGNLKVTEINIRHMAYTGIMAKVGFDLISDTIEILRKGNAMSINREPFYHYDKSYIFLRDVDIEPIILDGEGIFYKNK
jgi:carbamoyl-phosphate synthase large subunit